MNDKKMRKNEKRFYNYKFDKTSEIFVCKQKDDKCVPFTINFDIKAQCRKKVKVKVNHI